MENWRFFTGKFSIGSKNNFFLFWEEIHFGSLTLFVQAAQWKVTTLIPSPSKKQQENKSKNKVTKTKTKSRVNLHDDSTFPNIQKELRLGKTNQILRSLNFRFR